MPSCSKVSPLGLLTGGGPNVAANIQAGKTNTQTVGTTSNYAPSVSLKPKTRVDKIEQNQTTNYELPLWVWVVFIVLFIVGWVTDTPATMVRDLVKRNKK